MVLRVLLVVGEWFLLLDTRQDSRLLGDCKNMLEMAYREIWAEK